MQDSHEELTDLVVLDLKWLLTTMKVIVELTTHDDVAKITLEQKRKLEKNGVADFEVFEVCWKEFVSAPIGVHHLCLIFQAYCLLYPVQSISLCEGAGASESNQFIIPCKLPDNILDQPVWFNMIKEFTTFYFDFHEFLPDEIYHRLICLASSYSEQNEDMPNCYSKRSCFFSRLYDTNWAIEMEEERQTLKIMVL